MTRQDEERLFAAQHAMQSGVKFDMETGSNETPKHLRVGVNSALVFNGALAKLLIDKSIITEDEYDAACADAMEAEVARYEAILSERVGTKVTLG